MPADVDSTVAADSGMTPSSMLVLAAALVDDRPRIRPHVEGATAELLERASRDDYDRWLTTALAAGGCVRPIRLRGTIREVDTVTGEVVKSLDTDDLPDNAIYVPCGDRRASVCPPCAETYRADTYQLIRAGLAGGKGMPESLAAHPRVFATFTAPSFGAVHSRVTTSGGAVARWRPRRKLSGDGVVTDFKVAAYLDLQQPRRGALAGHPPHRSWAGGVMKPEQRPVGVSMSADVEYRPDRPEKYRARVRWVDTATKTRRSKSRACSSEELALVWIEAMRRMAQAGIDPDTATMTLADYGESVMPLALRGLEAKTTDPYLAGWRKRVVPTLGHLPLTMVTNGAVDRAVHAWIAGDCTRSTVKDSLAALARVMEQAVRDGIVDRNPARVIGWQREYRRAEDELDDPRALALPSWQALCDLAAALVARSADQFVGWGEVVIFAACTAARIGEVAGARCADIDANAWTWTVRRQTTPSPGGLVDKGTKGKRARTVPLIEEVRPLVQRRLEAAGHDPAARVFTGPRGGRITTAVLRDATHWDEVVTQLGHEHLRRHDLRHTGLTWMADAGVPVHVLRKIAGHGSLVTTQRYLHPDDQSIAAAGTALSAHLTAKWSPDGPQLRLVQGSER